MRGFSGGSSGSSRCHCASVTSKRLISPTWAGLPQSATLCRHALAYKPEHAVDLDTGAVVAAEVHPADQGDTTTITGTLDAAQRNLTSVGAPPSPDDPAECVADKGYHSRAVLTDLDGGPWKTRIAEPQRRGVSRWHGDAEARRAVYNNRTRLRSDSSWTPSFRNVFWSRRLRGRAWLLASHGMACAG